MADKVEASVPTATDVTPAAPVAPVAPTLVEVELHTSFRTNSTTYGAGATEDNPVTISVAPDIAEDLLRRQTEYDVVEKDKQKVKRVTINSGVLDAGK